MDAQLPTEATASNTAPCSISIIIIGGLNVRIVTHEQKNYLALPDLTTLLGYASKYNAAFKEMLANHGYDLSEYLIRVPINRMQAINDAGLRLICKFVRARRATVLHQWLDNHSLDTIVLDGNSMHFDAYNPPLQNHDRVRSLYAARLGKVVKVYGDGSACIAWDDGEPQAEGLGHERLPRELLVLDETANVSNLNNATPNETSLPTQSQIADVSNSETIIPKPAKVAKTCVDARSETSAPNPNQDPSKKRAERRKQYSRELCRIIARYADEAESLELARSLEDMAATILARRYCPGLNAASYDVFARYGLQGGVL